jgi:hypothetical protein
MLHWLLTAVVFACTAGFTKAAQYNTAVAFVRDGEVLKVSCRFH